MTQDSRPQTILVTGGCGFIGTNLVKYLADRSYKVRILDNLSTSSRLWTSNPQQTQVTQETPDSGLSTANLMVGDIRDRQAVVKAMDGIDAIVHLAAHTSVVESSEDPTEDWDVNVNGTLNLLEVSRQNRVERFVFASSNAVVGEQPPPIDEMRTPQPLSPYGASKLAAEALCSAYYHSFGLKTVSLRFANCYGPYSDQKPSVIARFVESAKEGKPLIIYGDGNQTRDFIHVDDICHAIHLTLIVPDSRLQPLDSRLFQIGTGAETSINELAELIKEIATDSRLSTPDYRLLTIYELERNGEIRSNYSDISKARMVLGFKPKVELRTGLHDLWQSYTGAAK